MIGLRGLARAPWDAPDTSAADEAADLAAAAHAAQCATDDAAAEREAADAQRLPWERAWTPADAAIGGGL